MVIEDFVIKRFITISDVEEFLDALGDYLERKLSYGEWEYARSVYARHHFDLVRQK